MKITKPKKMTLKTTPYTTYETALPQTGKHIIGQLRGDNIIVYQAYNPYIAHYAVKHQKFGGGDYSFSRMSWIKPNFLWMMYRAGWAEKPNQEHILAIEIGLDKFEILLKKAVHTSFQPDIYASHEDWTQQLNQSEIRLQWDPDHNPLGHKLERKAVQIGIKGALLQQFATDWIVSIEDITDFVKQQTPFVKSHEWDKLMVMEETVIPIQNKEIIEKVDIDKL
jgi:Domain of unknown function (DUF4291)